MLSIESEVRRAFEEDEFYPVFQPQVELRSGRLIGFEVLARWKHSRLGEVPPDEFIPLVERSGFIDLLTRTLLEKSFSSSVLAASSLGLSFNITPLQLLGPRIAERIAGAAEQSGFALDRLTIEMTESALLDDLPRAQAVADELKALRCKLALDDFGTGYSSLKHLHALQFDELKIDRTFVGSMVDSRESRKIVASVVGLGQSLGLLTVAEGVETQEQADVLLWLGCDFGQGWLFGRPKPTRDLGAMMESARATPSVVVPSFWNGHSVLSPETLPAQRFALLQAVYDGAPVGLCFLDRNIRYVSLNRRLAQLNGVSAAAHLGRTPAEVIPATWPIIEPYVRRALAGEPVIGIEINKPPLEPGAETRTLLISYQPARDEAGEVLGVSVALMDITERKAMEDALRESDAHHQHTFELTPHVLWVLNEKGEVIEGGRNWELLTGMPLEEALGSGWMKALHPDDVAHTVAAVQNTLATGQPVDIEYRIRRPDGSWHWMRSRGSARLGPSGEVIRVYGSLEEIEEHKRSLAALERAQAYLDAVFAAVPAGLIFADELGCIVRMNAQAERIFSAAVQPGWPAACFRELHFARMDGSPIPAESNPIVHALASAQPSAASEILLDHVDGSRTQLDWRTCPVVLSNGEAAGALLVVCGPASSR
jgi:PAS domain S-box-containing protein